MKHVSIDFDKQPILVFWEVTKACSLACKHCRANAILEPLPGELSKKEGMNFIDSLTEFGKPYPVLIFTGGDPLMRSDIFDLIEHARALKIPVAVAPTVTETLISNLDKLKELNVNTLSISLDGATPKTHDEMRGIDGHFKKTIAVLKLLRDWGFKVQINTTVTKLNVYELADIAKIVYDHDIYAWEVFFLIYIGRGSSSLDITPPEYEDVLHFLYESSKYTFTVRTVEAPFFRRIVLSAENGITNYRKGTLYTFLVDRLHKLLGPPSTESKAYTVGTRDGKGIIFVAYNGDVYPSGFSDYKVGNIRGQSIVKIYRESEILKKIRDGRFKGRCGVCEYNNICGGSRARAYKVLGDILEEDPACIYLPRRYLKEQ